MPITLAPLTAEHLPGLEGLFTQAELVNAAGNPDAFHYRAVVDGEKCVGMVGLNMLGDPQIVAAVIPAERRKGYATAAVNEMVRFAFNELNLPEVYAMCQAGSPSNGLVTKVGYLFHVQQGNNRFYRLPKETWQAVQQAAGEEPGTAALVAENAAADKPADQQEQPLRTWLLDGFLSVEARTKSEARALFKKQRPIPPRAKIE
jgi:hypothetical protein